MFPDPRLRKGSRKELSDGPQTPQSRDPGQELPQKPSRAPAIQAPLRKFSSSPKKEKDQTSNQTLTRSLEQFPKFWVYFSFVKI